MNKFLINQKARELRKLLKNEKLDPRNGLPSELFLLASSITPIPNIDLMIFDEKNRILLSWRDDEFYGEGWHMVGSCIRMHETMEDSIWKCAMRELESVDIFVNPMPLVVRDAIGRGVNLISNDDFVRSHNLSVLFKCLVKPAFTIEKINKGKSEKSNGFLKWFEKKPLSILPALATTYGDILDDWNDGKITY